MNNAYLIFLSHQKFSIKSMPKTYTNQESSAYDDGNGYSHVNREIKVKIYLHIFPSVHPNSHPSISFKICLSIFLTTYLQ